MSTIAETLMVAGFARIDSSPALCDNVRRTHRVHVTREEAPAIYWIDGKDEPTGKLSECSRTRRKHFTVSVFGRDDDGVTPFDSLVEAVNDRLMATPFDSGITCHQGAIEPDTEIADTDASRIDMAYWFEYEAAPGWSL